MDPIALLHCERCPLQSVRQPIVGSGPAKAKLVIIGEAPGTAERQYGKPFAGPSGKLLRMILEEWRIDPKEVYYTHALLCQPMNEARSAVQPSKTMLSACRNRLIAEIRYREPQIVLTLGAIPAQVFFGDVKLTDIIATTHWHSEIDSWILSTYHPSSILHGQYGYFDDIYYTLRKVAMLLNGSIPFPNRNLVIEYEHITQWSDTKMTEEYNRIRPEDRDAYDDHIASYDDEEIFEILLNLSTASRISLDLETNGFSSVKDPVLQVAMATLDRTYVFEADVLLREPFYTTFQTMLLDTNIEWVLHNMSFDLQFIEREWHVVPKCVLDTMTLALCLTEKGERVGLKRLTREYLSADYYEAELAKYPYKKSFNNIPRAVMARYAAKDVYYTIRLPQALIPLCDAEGTLETAYKLLMPAQKAFAQMEATGVKIDLQWAAQLTDLWAPRISDAINDLRMYAKELGFNPAAVVKDPPKDGLLNPRSFPQLQHLVYDILKFPLTNGTRTTGVDFLEKYPGAPITEKLKALREVDHLQKAYVNGIVDDVDIDGRAHPDILLFGTVTGRLSIRNPPLQCVTGDTFVYSNGLRRIASLIPMTEGTYTKGVFIQTPSGRATHTSYEICKWSSTLLQITLTSGVQIRCTPDHPFYLASGEKIEAQLLQPRHVLQSAGEMQYYGYVFQIRTARGDEGLTPSLCYLLGAWLATGTDTDGLKLRIYDPTVRHYLQNSFPNVEVDRNIVRLKDPTIVSLVRTLWKPIERQVSTKYIPEVVLQFTERLLKSVIEGILDAGTKLDHLDRLSMSGSETLMREVQLLVYAVTGNMAKLSPTPGTAHTYTLQWSKRCSVLLCNEFSLVHSSMMKDHHYAAIEFTQPLWTVEGIETVDGDYVYDVTVPEEHQFLANGLVVSNTLPKWGANPDLAKLVRKLFVAAPGYTLIEADYAQLELRIAWHYSEDEKLGEALLSGDFHRSVSMDIFHKRWEEVTKMDRFVSKFVTFGIMYGRQAYSLAQGELKEATGGSERKAQEYINKWFAKFPKYHAWWQAAQQTALREGRLTTTLGRVRRWNFITSEIEGDIKNQAVNFPIQSLASDLCLSGCIRLNEILRALDYGRPLFTVHDAIVFEVRTDKLLEALPIITSEMQKPPFTTCAQFDVEVDIGQNLGELSLTAVFADSYVVQHGSQSARYHGKDATYEMGHLTKGDGIALGYVADEAQAKKFSAGGEVLKDLVERGYEVTFCKCARCEVQIFYTRLPEIAFCHECATKE